MICNGINGKLHFCLDSFQRLDHLLRCRYRNNIILRSVKSPNGYMLKVLGEFRVPASADRSDRSESLGMNFGQSPSAEAAHAESGDINAFFIHMVLGDHFI